MHTCWPRTHSNCTHCGAAHQSSCTFFCQNWTSSDICCCHTPATVSLASHVHPFQGQLAYEHAWSFQQQCLAPTTLIFSAPVIVSRNACAIACVLSTISMLSSVNKAAAQLCLPLAQYRGYSHSLANMPHAVPRCISTSSAKLLADKLHWATTGLRQLLPLAAAAALCRVL